MQFVDKCLSDSAIYTIENMVENHISGNYQNVRDVILGYDSKCDIWKSKYGEYISKRNMFNIDPPTKPQIYVLRNRNTAKDEKSADTFIKNNGMSFYDDEVYEYIRIYMDDSVKRVLEVLFTLSKNVIEYRDIVDIIITEWNVNNIRDTISLNGIYTDLGICGNLHYYKLEVRKNPWEDFKRVTRHRGLTIRDAFKDAVITFLEGRNNIINVDCCTDVYVEDRTNIINVDGNMDDYTDDH
jgi:hypothetical protein